MGWGGLWGCGGVGRSVGVQSGTLLGGFYWSLLIALKNGALACTHALLTSLPSTHHTPTTNLRLFGEDAGSEAFRSSGGVGARLYARP